MNRVFTLEGERVKNLVLQFKKMDSETFTMRKNFLEEFYKERVKFNISKIEIHQDNPEINIYEHVNNIFFKTHINFTSKKFLIREFYKHIKPIICYA